MGNVALGIGNPDLEPIDGTWHCRRRCGLRLHPPTGVADAGLATLIETTR
jgi:hypothetical protein